MYSVNMHEEIWPPNANGTLGRSPSDYDILCAYPLLLFFSLLPLIEITDTAETATMAATFGEEDMIGWQRSNGWISRV